MTVEFTRRGFLLSVGAGVAVLSAGLGTVPALADTGDIYADLLARRRAGMLGSPETTGAPALAELRTKVDEEIAAYRAGIIREPGRDSIWEDAPLDNLGVWATRGDHLQTNFERLTQLSLGWASSWSEHHDDEQLLADILESLEFMAERYTPDLTVVGNWYKYEIGSPKNITDTLTILGDAVPERVRSDLLAAIRAHAPNPNRRRSSPTLKETGANRADKALARILVGLLDGDEDDVLLGRGAVVDDEGGGELSLLGLTTSGDGFYADGSFVQHDRLPYSGNYGKDAISGISNVAQLLAGSEWEFTEAELDESFGFVEQTFFPVQWDARAMDTTRGRMVSRQWDTDYNAGILILSAISRLAEAAPADVAGRWRSQMKGMLTRTTDRSYRDSVVDVASAARLLDIETAPDVEAAAPQVGIYNTVAQERLIHRRGDWAAVVNTSSTRIGRYEWGNYQNRRGWHQGDGMLFIYHRNDSGQFSDDLWPTIDPDRLPGITVNGEEHAPSQDSGTAMPAADNEYAGGVTLNGVIGTTAMDFMSPSGKLRAQKSWFHLEDAVVCVGTGITDDSGTPTVTVLENRSFEVDSLPEVTVDGALVDPGEEPIEVTEWTHLDTHAGVVLLTPAEKTPQPAAWLSAARRTGTWWDIDQGGNSAGDEIERVRDYVTIERHHETAADYYAYMILPLAGAADVAERSERPGVDVVVADDQAHVVETDAGIRMGHFFAAGEYGGYAVDGPCSFGWGAPIPARERSAAGAQTTEVVVSRPTKDGDSVEITFPHDAPGTIESVDEGVTVVGTSPLALRLDDADPRGSEHRVVFASLATAEPVTVRFEDPQGRELAPTEYLHGELGDRYDARPVEIEGYEPREPLPENASGSISEEPITVVFVYVPVDTGGSGGAGGSASADADGSDASAEGSTGGPNGGSGGPGGEHLPSTGAGIAGWAAAAFAATAAGAGVLRSRRVSNGTDGAPDLPPNEEPEPM